MRDSQEDLLLMEWYEDRDLGRRSLRDDMDDIEVPSKRDH